MASDRLSVLTKQVAESPIGGCVVPSEPYHQRSARTLALWESLESLGFVRLIAEPDDDMGPSDFDDEQDRETLARDGAWGSVGQFRTDFEFRRDWVIGGGAGHDWQTADSVWGHVGYRDVLDWRENPYVLDIMAETIRQFRDAWKAHVRSRCPHCGRSERSLGCPPPEGHDSWAEFSHATQPYQHYNRATGRAERID